MLSDDDYQSIKVSLLTAAEAANKVANSNQTVYYDEEMYARVYESLTRLKSNLVRVFSELDLFRSMFREQVAEQMRTLLGEQEVDRDAGSRVEDLGAVPSGAVAPVAGEAVGSEPTPAADAVAAVGSQPPPKAKRPYRRRNKAALPQAATPVESNGGGEQMGGASAD